MESESDSAAVRSEIDSYLNSTDPAEQLVLHELIVGLQRQTREEVNPKSDIVTPTFASSFLTRLKLFHAVHDGDQVLQKKPFEFAFRAASQADNKEAEITSSPTNPGPDVRVDETKYSLKTEAAQSIKRNHITISKLMESAWTKDCTSLEDFHAGLFRITDHLRSYDRILTLRAFGRLSKGEVRYDLVEIPTDLLLLIGESDVSEFGPITRAGGTTLPVKFREEPAFRAVFDGSDQKITIRNLRTALCLRHASWSLLGGGGQDLWAVPR